MPVPGTSQQVQFPTPPETGIAAGTLFTWGSQIEGHLGDGTNTGTPLTSPVQVGALSWLMVACGAGASSTTEGHGHTMAIRSDGLLFGWGDNGFGQLGDGTATDRSSPVQVGSSSWKMVAAGSNNSHAIRLDGTLWTWGDGANGALGDSTNTSKSSPVQIGASSWKWVTGSEIGGFAIDIAGRLFAWGTGVNGIIGDGTSTGKNSPVQIGTSSWTMVHAAKNNTLAIALRIDGLLFAWGNNTSGNLGVNSATVTFSSPVAIGASSWQMCAIMNQGGLAVRVDGTLWSWGSLPGDNTITGKSSPVQIGASTWSKVYAGGPIKWAIRSDNTLWNWGSGSGTGVPVPSTSSPVQVGTSAWIGVDSAFNAAVSAINLFSAGIKQ